MNSIKLEIPFNANNVALVKTLLSKVTNDKNEVSTDVEETEDDDKPEKKAPARKPRPSRAKKPPVVEEDEDEDDDFADADDSDDEDEDEITEDTLRELSAKKIGKHKEAIIAQLAKYKVKGWGNLPEKHYQAMHDFLTKLK